ncbi:MAG: C45 family peptidase [Actinomycetota bacterium]
MLDPLELGTTFGEGLTPGKRQVRLFDLRGEHYEMGFQQGLQAREAIHHLFDNLDQVEAFQLEKPALVPFKVFMGMTTRRAVGEMWGDISEHCPNQRTRMEGIAKGADIDGSLLYLALAGELILARTNYRLGACTAAAVEEGRSALGEPMVIKNFDYPPFFQPHYITRLSQPADTASTLDVTVAPLAGCHDGINEHGLCISYNYGYGTDMPNVNVPISLLVQEALEKCASTREAIEFLGAGKRSGGAILLVADASGDISTIEMSSNFSGVRQPQEGIIINTNHYKCREMVSYDIPRNAYYTSKNAKALRGVRVHESSELRYGRAEQLFAELETVGMRDLLRVFCDHGESGRGDDNTICRHGPYFSTTCSIIMLPRSRRLLVTYGHPCDSVFSDFLDPFRREEGEAVPDGVDPENGPDARSGGV